MSHTNSTTNYGLPEFLSSDKPAWMGDMNPAFSDIDAQMKLNADAVAQANTDIGTVGLNFAAGYSNVSTYDVGDVVTYNKRMYVCDVAVTVPEAFDNSKWSYYKCSDIAHTAKEAEASASAVAGDVSDINDAIGNTDISAIGDGTLTGAISSVNANLSYNPDWSNAVSYTVGQPASISGILHLACPVGSGSNIAFSMNGIPLQANGMSLFGAGTYSLDIPIKKGDTLSVTMGTLSGNAYAIIIPIFGN